jgi:hypothetical protein
MTLTSASASATGAAVTVERAKRRVERMDVKCILYLIKDWDLDQPRKIKYGALGSEKNNAEGQKMKRLGKEGETMRENAQGGDGKSDKSKDARGGVVERLGDEGFQQGAYGGIIWERRSVHCNETISEPSQT